MKQPNRVQTMGDVTGVAVKKAAWRAELSWNEPAVQCHAVAGDDLHRFEHTLPQLSGKTDSCQDGKLG